MGIIDFKISTYFSGTIIFLGIVLFFAGLAFVFTNIIVSLIVFLVCTIIFTTHYRLKIDFDNKEFFDYIWILGLKTGDKGKFQNIEYIFIKTNRVSQALNFKSRSTIIYKEVYDAYLKFSETNKIHLMTRDNKKYLIEGVQRMAMLMRVKIIDYSDSSAAQEI